MRLFVAVWPPAEVVTLLEGIRRPAVRGVQWTTPDQWHVTLRFLGNVEDGALDEVVDAVGGAIGAVAATAIEARLGPASELLHGRVVSVPVAGLDEVGRAVVAATASIGRPPESRAFRGHLTLARLKSVPARAARRLAGTPLAATWPVERVDVVRSDLTPDGARYETIGSVGLIQGAGPG
jgi:2'-5' RNA ligase